MKMPDRLHKLLYKNKYTMPILQGLGIIAIVTAVSVISVHVLIGESLTDYAESNPETAYAVHTEDIPEADTVEDAAGTPDVTDTVETDAKEAENEVLTEEVNESDDPATEEDENGSTAETSEIPEYSRSVMIHFYDPSTGGEGDIDHPGRTVYEPGFYYEPLSDSIKDYITGISYPADASSSSETTVNSITGTPAVSYDDLAYVGLLYVDFNGLTQAGELICNKKIAQDMVEIFHELYTSDYRIDSIYLVDNYGGDDTASMCADNTSCFNYRVVDGSTSLSKHAYGLAIDINPFYNPYIVFGAGEGGSDYISPPGSEIYTDRSASFAYKIDDSDLCYRLFTSHGFKWGGDWNSCKDYQHFQKTF